MSINRVVLTGNLTRDAELKQTQGGPLVKMRLAVNDRRKVGDQWTDVANFVDVIMFGTRAESVSRFLVKGKQVGIDGRLRMDEWTDKEDGQKRSKLEVYADNIELLGSRSDSAGPRPVTEASFVDEPGPDVPDGEDIPF
jgi:single-strand DNA-binding protein